MVVGLCFLDQTWRVIGVVHFCSLGGKAQKVQRANIHTLVCPKMSNCSPAASHYRQSVTQWLIVCTGKESLTGARTSLNGASSWRPQEARARPWRDHRCSSNTFGCHCDAWGLLLEACGETECLF